MKFPNIFRSAALLCMVSLGPAAASGQTSPPRLPTPAKNFYAEANACETIDDLKCEIEARFGAMLYKQVPQTEIRSNIWKYAAKVGRYYIGQPEKESDYYFKTHMLHAYKVLGIAYPEGSNLAAALLSELIELKVHTETCHDMPQLIQYVDKMLALKTDWVDRDQYSEAEIEAFVQELKERRLKAETCEKSEVVEQ